MTRTTIRRQKALSEHARLLEKLSCGAVSPPQRAAKTFAEMTDDERRQWWDEMTELIDSDPDKEEIDFSEYKVRRFRSPEAQEELERNL